MSPGRQREPKGLRLLQPPFDLGAVHRDLRHHPERVGLTLEPAGWVRVDDLLEAVARHGRTVTRSMIEEVVLNNDKQRFAFSENRKRIRASQGHSVEVGLAYKVREPPPVLYHGTTT